MATTYDIGKEIGIEMRRRLEKNLKRYVMAAVIAAGCGVLLVGLKTPWYIDFAGVFSSYLVASYSLSEFFRKNP